MPYLVQVRKGKHCLGNTYPERVQGLFNWDDDIPRTFWDHCYYRQLARKFYKSISASVNLADAEDWKHSLGRLALPYFWIIPNYNKHSLFIRLPRNANRSAATRPFISGICQWRICDNDLDLYNDELWLFGGSTYLGGRPGNFMDQDKANPEAVEVDALVTPTYVIDFRYAIPFREIPQIIEEGFEASRKLFAHGNPKVLAHYEAARDCLEQCLGDPLCDVLLMIVPNFCVLNGHASTANAQLRV